MEPIFQNPHLQTLYATWYPAPNLSSLTTERFELPDGDFVDCVWYGKPVTGSDVPIVVLFHGLTGSIRSPYILRTMEALRSRDFVPVLMHFRGCGGEINRLPRLYHSGDTADAKSWIAELRKRYPESPLFGVGFSLGGNMLLKLMGEMGEHAPLEAAVVVSAPMDLAACAVRIDQGFSKRYQRHLLKPLHEQLWQKYAMFDMEALIELKKEELERLDTFWKFDDAYTAPIHGFEDVHDYYAKSSARQYLHAIRKPTLIIHAKDDPFTGADVIPTPEELAHSVTLEVYEHGGHLGFVGGSFVRPDFWLYERIGDYLSE